MTSQIETLLEQINGGQPELALPELDQLLQQQPTDAAALALRAEALRLLGRIPEAIDAYRRAGEHSAGARSWLVAGLLLASDRKTDDALHCLRRAHAEAPNDDQVIDSLITTFFNSNRHNEAVEFARLQLRTGTNPRYLSNAALLLQSADLYEEATEAFKKIVALAPDDPSIIGAALAPTRFTCEWDWIEELQQKIGSWYDQGEFAAPQEYPLTHLTWCADEARNFGVTRAYAERLVPRVEPCTPSMAPVEGRRLRVGYLSSDFRNHATMHLMAGLLEYHDRQRFEVFAYDFSSHDISDYRQRFLYSVEHHVEIHSLSDQEAASRIARDRLDILFDLKGYTGGSRPGILAYRPAPVQAAYLGFPGSVANPYIDYIVSDRFVTPDSSTPYYSEKFCRLPHTYQCNDRKRFSAAEPGPRAMYGLPEGKVVFGAFNQSYKIDRNSFRVWLRILAAVPDSVLWVLGQSQAAIANLLAEAQRASIDSERLIFAPFADPRSHLSRLQHADAVLDALVCNGHTTTSDALWTGVPVITSRGSHFCSRVSESLLNAMELAELVGADQDDMVQIATRIGTDAEYRAGLRAKVGANRLTTPLFDTARFARDFETAIELMVQQHHSGVIGGHIDVPDRGPVDERAGAPGASMAATPMQADYPGCPLCGGMSTPLGFANCTQHVRWHPRLPPTLEWMRCASCSHVHTRHHWTAAGRAEIFRNAGGDSGKLADDRARWTPVVERVIQLRGGYSTLLGDGSRPVWVDAGCGTGTLIMTAGDYGFTAVGLDTDGSAVNRIKGLGFNALQHDFMELRFEVIVDVLSLVNVLEQIAEPRAAVLKVAQVLRPGGILVVGTADLSSSSWKIMDTEKTNPHWQDLERHHNFGRERLLGLLKECGFEVVGFSVPPGGRAEMEIFAVKPAG
jgi:predicted O-linked N-acetylglucosamine transferase (SPINDLY family)/SAM-dependent methyltransferase